MAINAEEIHCELIEDKRSPFCPPARDFLKAAPSDCVMIITGIVISVAVSFFEQPISKRSTKENKNNSDTPSQKFQFFCA